MATFFRVFESSARVSTSSFFRDQDNPTDVCVLYEHTEGFTMMRDIVRYQQTLSDASAIIKMFSIGLG